MYLLVAYGGSVDRRDLVDVAIVSVNISTSKTFSLTAYHYNTSNTQLTMMII